MRENSCLIRRRKAEILWKRNINGVDAEFLNGDAEDIATFFDTKYLISPSLFVEVEKHVARHLRSTVECSSTRTNRAFCLVLHPVSSLAFDTAIVDCGKIHIGLASLASLCGWLLTESARLRGWRGLSHVRITETFSKEYRDPSYVKLLQTQRRSDKVGVTVLM